MRFEFINFTWAYIIYYYWPSVGHAFHLVAASNCKRIGIYR
jgi:hypothetical protein